MVNYIIQIKFFIIIERFYRLYGVFKKVLTVVTYNHKKLLKRDELFCLLIDHLNWFTMFYTYYSWLDWTKNLFYI